MMFKLRFPIRYKILLLLSGMILAAVGFYLALASKIFYEDKTLLLYELNQLSVKTLASEVQRTVAHLADQLRLLGKMDSQNSKSYASTLGVDVVAVRKITKGGQTVWEQIWDDRLALDGHSRDALNRLEALPQVAFEGEWLRRVVLPKTQVSGPVSMGQLVVSSGGQTLWAIFRTDRLAKLFAQKGLSENYMSDSRGRLFLHSNPEVLQKDAELDGDELVQRALSSRAVSEVRKVASEGQDFLGSTARVGKSGWVVASRVPMERAFEAAQRLFRKTLLYAAIIVTAAFLASLFFSHSLTSPIQNMMFATGEIAAGKFDIELTTKTADELGLLAGSINSMSANLKASREEIERHKAQLVRSERLAAIGQVSRGIGHDFGNLLQSIVGKADLALSSENPEKMKGNLETILKAAESGAVMIQNLQSFAKEPGKKTPLKLHKVVEDSIDLVSHDFNKRTITLETKIEPQEFLGSAVELQQVLVNLMINAMHAMPKGGTLTVGCTSDAEAIRIWVKDTGTGIPPEVLPHIFEYAYTTKGDKGSGLGLSISKEIIEDHGGTLSVQTAFGQGTQFDIVFPKA